MFSLGSTEHIYWITSSGLNYMAKFQLICSCIFIGVPTGA